jgi:hypothetical protein
MNDNELEEISKNIQYMIDNTHPVRSAVRSAVYSAVHSAVDNDLREAK